jgi:hypothetical protein
MCAIYLDSCAWFSVLCIATASAKTKERSKAKHQCQSRDLEAAILTRVRRKVKSRKERSQELAADGLLALTSKRKPRIFSDTHFIICGHVKIDTRKAHMLASQSQFWTSL